MADTTRRKRTARAQTGPRSTPKAKAEAEAADETPGFVVDGVKYDLNDLELGELGELEDHVGLPMDLISYGSAKTIAFVVYLVKRRSDPNYTLDEAQKIKVKNLGRESESVEVDTGPDPT